MSTNCLVKKYKAEVNNNNLPFYGRVKIYFDQIESASNLSNGLRRYADMFKDRKVEVVGNVYFANSSLQSLGVKELNQSYLDPFYVTNGKGVLLLSDSVQQIISVAGAGSVEKAYYIKLEEFTEITSLTNVSIRNSVKSEGNIINLAQCVGLTDFNFGDTKVEGNFAEFAIAQIDKYGRSSGSLLVSSSSHILVYDTIAAVNRAQYTINYTDSTHFNIVAPTYTVSFTKSGGVWSYEVTT